jgi:putative DNA methylase
MKKKLIEVALPLEAINKEAGREKSLRHGHPSTLHLWWARRPLAACRAVLFASLVDDPSSHPEQFPTEADQDRERQRLFRMLEELVKWENSNNRAILEAAQKEILKSTGGNPPPIYDPFCGGGSIPLEAQRLGLETHASDLNPIAVLITKALIEIPKHFANRPPTNPAARNKISAPGMWPGAYGLADDVRYYGQLLRDRAWERIGHLYPRATIGNHSGDRRQIAALAWIWARTVRCPNPACQANMPLVTSFALSNKPGSRAWVEPCVDHATKIIRYRVRTGDGSIPDSPKTGRGAKFKCIVCGQPASDQYIKDEGSHGKIGQQMLAVVGEGERGRVYLDPTDEDMEAASKASPRWAPEEELAYEPRAIWCTLYGLRRFGDLFTARQLAALTELVELVSDIRQQAVVDGAEPSRADAIATYLAFAVDKVIEGSSNLCTWSPLPTKLHVRGTFGRQGLPMVWDYAEANPFAKSSGNIERMTELVAEVLEFACSNAGGAGLTSQLDASSGAIQGGMFVVSTDPPYYDNIGYADLSDFFYVWLRRSLKSIYPDLFSTLLVPKRQELIASPYRHEGDKQKAQTFFEEKFAKASSSMRDVQNPQYPMTVYYAFKQSESDEDENGKGTSAIVSTGWETMLEGLQRANFSIVGTWPMRSEKSGRMVSVGTNALASSIVLVCRPLQENAIITTRKDFLSSLKRELPQALRNLQKGNIAPVDLAQAAIGPGMAVFSRYKRVLESDGTPMRVRTALALINQTLDEVLSEQESDFDSATRWALAWFEQNQFSEGAYGQAELLATAKALAVSGLVDAGIVHSRAGKVRLLKRSELPPDWDPTSDGRLTVWEVTQHLIRCLETRGEADTAALKAKIGGLAETSRELAYRLYTLCERKGWAEEAGYYNSLVVAWPAISQVPELFQQQ